MEPVPSVERAFSPLDEQLELGPGDLTPHAQEGLARLGSWVPFGRAAELIEALLGVRTSKATARRITLETGKAGLEQWQQEHEQLSRELPEVQQQAQEQVMSADGAMVPLVGGAWGEVKTLVIGTLKRDESGEVHLGDLSYCSRMMEVEHFEQETLGETHRRGLERAKEVAAVMDGAEWLQGFIDYHRADAVRILDFPHAAEYVSSIGEAVRESGHHLPMKWLDGVLHRLKHEGPDRVLVHLKRLCQQCKQPDVWKKYQYLSSRRELMQYPAYQAAGWPIGSGMVESANKVVVEARLKGAGMHWDRQTVNPMLLLRNAVCNDRWDDTWKQSSRQQQQSRKLQRLQQTQQRCEQAAARFFLLLLPCLPPTPPPALVSPPIPSFVDSHPRRPAANHPWRRPVVPHPKKAPSAKS